MTKIKTSFAVLLVCLFSITFTAGAQNLSPAETDFANFVVKADIDLEKGDSQSAETEMSQAEAILVSNPDVDQDLQGHFYKVKGKFYMKDSLAAALSYFNLSLARFSATPSEQARVRTFIGIAYFYANDFSLSENYFNDAKTYFLANNDQSGYAQVINNLGILAFQNSDEGNAVAMCDQAYSVNSSIGKTAEASKNQQNISYFLEDNFARASKRFDNVKDIEIVNHGGSGTPGSGTTIDTNGGGTVVVNQRP